MYVLIFLAEILMIFFFFNVVNGICLDKSSYFLL